VAAFVANAKLIDELAEGSPEWDAALERLRRLLPGLRAVGVPEYGGRYLVRGARPAKRNG
jgi:hypothetical protein